jgi:hypothetical protein
MALGRLHYLDECVVEATPAQSDSRERLHPRPV